MTVLELLIFMAALAVVVLISVPASGVFIEKWRLKCATGTLSSSLEIARSEALMRGSTVRVCPSSNGRSCRSDNNWNLGWLVFSDGNADGQVQDIEFIRAFNAPHDQIRILADGAVQNRVSFTVTGLDQENGADSGQFLLCYAESQAQPTLVSVEADGWVVRGPASEKACQAG